MKKLITICAVLLVAQLGLALWTNLRGPGDAAGTVQGPLVKGAAGAVDELLLETGEGATLRLKKTAGRWLLPEVNDFPADSARVQALVERIAGLARTWPEATTSEAASRFKVAADRFAHRLTLRGGGADLGRVYLGSSAGLRRVYLRGEGETDILSIELDPRDLETGVDNWIDTAVLQLKAEEVARLELPDLTLVRQSDSLVVEGLTEGEELVPASRDALVQRVTGLSVAAVLGGGDPAGSALAKPSLRFSVQRTTGERLDYVFGQAPQPPAKGQEEAAAPPAETTYVLRVSGHERLFRVDGWQVDEIRHLNRAALVRAKAKPAPVAPANTAPVPPAGNGS